jgi:ABC-type Fe3+/spermidine/putrescine transport system ATPase subunit
MKELRVEKVTKSYGSLRALDGVSLTVEASELVVIMGPSGSGKTTLLLTVLGVLRADEGHVYLGGDPIDDLPIEERRIGYLPQDFGLFPHLSVRDNVAFGLRVAEYPKGVVAKRVQEVLSLVELEGFETRMPSQLSGGEKQRVALARALAINPSLLLLDEPLSNVDEATKAEVRMRLKKIIAETRVTTVCVIHDARDAFDLGDRIAVMHAGKIIQLAKPPDLVKSPSSDLVRSLIASVC